MYPNEYQVEALKKEADQILIREKRLAGGLQYSQFTSGFDGLVDEVGELADIKKSWIEQEKTPDRAHVLEECGDILWRTCQILSSFDLTLQQAMEANLAKLKHRYKDRLSPQEALEENRDRVGEARAMVEAVLNIKREKEFL